MRSKVTCLMTSVICLFILQEKCGAEVFTGKHGRSVSCCGWNHWWGVRERKVYPTRIVNMSPFWSFCLIFIGKMMIGISIIKLKKCLVCKMPRSHKQSQSCLYRTLPLLVVFSCCQGDSGEWSTAGPTEGQLQGKISVSYSPKPIVSV